MKKLFLLFFIFFAVSCTSIIVKTNDIAEVATRSYRSPSQISFDERIENTIKKLIKKDLKEFLSTNNINSLGKYDIKVFNNTVLLNGLFYSEKSEKYILEKIKLIPQVNDIINESLIVAIKLGFSNDGFISEGISLKLSFKSEIRTINYKISVVNGRVIVIGIAANENELNILTKSISTVKGVKEVISYVMLNNNI